MDRCGLTVPPTSSSKHRATTCAKTDIVNLTDLVLPASLGSLRHRDKLLFDLLQRTLNLQSDDIHHNEDSRLISTRPQLKMRKPTGDSRTKCLCNIDEWQLLLASVDQSLTLPVPLDGKKLSSYGSDNCFFSFLPILHSCLGLLLSWRAQLPC